jgi:hypothetical protein
MQSSMLRKKVKDVMIMNDLGKGCEILKAVFHKPSAAEDH